ncbi:MAG: serine/threonine-protein kinase [Candidatus Eremiobacteraeota bacterium]|nr:serine/threonine-protein kinase [Candidatus Eremiobacteraeota bacterium]
MEHRTEGAKRRARKALPFFPVMLPTLTAGTNGVVYTLVFVLLFPMLADQIRMGWNDSYKFAFTILPGITGLLTAWRSYRSLPWAKGCAALHFISVLILFALFMDSIWHTPLPLFSLLLSLAALVSLFATHRPADEEGKAPQQRGGQDTAKESGTPLFERKPGDTVKERYRIVRGIGCGATGSVYLVHDLQHPAGGVEWVMKEVSTAAAGIEEREETVKLFERECAILSALNHPAIPKVIEYFTERESLFLVMEAVRGENLESLVAGAGAPYDARRAVDLAMEIVQILEYLHGREPRPLIFRDLKPSNIILTERGKPRLIDFGIARLYDPEKERDTHIYGTPGFSPPEQYGAGQTDGRSDIYALGATLYYLLSLQDLQSFHFSFPALRKFNRKVSPELEGVVMKCLRRNPDERYQSLLPLGQELAKVQELLAADELQEGRDVSPLILIAVAVLVFPLSYLTLGNTMLVKAVASLSIAALCGAALYFMIRRRQQGTGP